jgi:hypothetical protein
MFQSWKEPARERSPYVALASASTCAHLLAQLIWAENLDVRAVLERPRQSSARLLYGTDSS